MRALVITLLALAVFTGGEAGNAAVAGYSHSPSVQTVGRCATDLDSNHLIDMQDLVLVANHYTEHVAPASTYDIKWPGDGLVDIADIVEVANWFAKECYGSVGATALDVPAQGDAPGQHLDCFAQQANYTQPFDGHWRWLIYGIGVWCPTLDGDILGESLECIPQVQIDRPPTGDGWELYLSGQEVYHNHTDYCFSVSGGWVPVAQMLRVSACWTVGYYGWVHAECQGEEYPFYFFY